MQRITTSALFIALGAGLFAQAVFTSSGTFVAPAGVNTISVELIGPGGNGGTKRGGGGGGGGYTAGNFTVSPGASYSIFIGTGGSGVASVVTRKLVNRRSVTISPSCKRLRPGSTGAEHARRSGRYGEMFQRGRKVKEGRRWLMNLGVTTLGDLNPDVACAVLCNPFTDRIVLRAPSGTEQYELWDATGRKLWSGARIESHDFSYLDPNSYFLKVNDGDVARIVRLIK